MGEKHHATTSINNKVTQNIKSIYMCLMIFEDWNMVENQEILEMTIHLHEELNELLEISIQR